MLLLNFSHPLTSKQIEQLRRLIGQVDFDIRSIPSQFDTEEPFVDQLKTLFADNPALRSVKWQSEELLVILPSLNYIAALVLAEIHGLSGHFPAFVRIRPANKLVSEYEIAEIVNLDRVRESARLRRGEEA